MIAISRQSASRAIVPTVREGLRHGSATQARLACAPWIDLHYSPTGAHSLVDEHRHEHRPSCIVDGLRQHPACQPFHVQIFDGDHTVFVHQLARFFVVKVPPLVRDVDMDSLEQEHSLAAAVAALLPARYLAGCTSQAGLSLPVVPRVLNLSAVRKHGEAIQSDVDSCRAITGRQQDGLQLDAEDREPPARLTLNRNRPNLAFERPMQFDLDVPRALHAQLAVREQSAAVAIGRERNAIVSTHGAVAWESRLLSALHSRKERLVRLVNPAQHVHATREIGQSETTIGAHRLHLIVLIVPTDRLTAGLPCIIAFLLCRIVERASLAQLACKKDLLRGSRIESVFEGAAFGCNLVCSHSVCSLRSVVRAVSMLKHRLGPLSYFITKLRLCQQPKGQSAIAEA